MPQSLLSGQWAIAFAASDPFVMQSTSTFSEPAPSYPALSDPASSNPLPSAATSSSAVTGNLKRINRARPSRPGITALLSPEATSISQPWKPQKAIPQKQMNRRQGASGQFHLHIVGTVACIGPIASATVSQNPAIASQCTNNEISTNAAAWTPYWVWAPSFCEAKRHCAKHSFAGPDVHVFSISCSCTSSNRCSGEWRISHP